MKSAFLLPLKYIFTTAVLTALFTLFSLLSSWGQTFIPGEGLHFEGTIIIITSVISRIFVLSAVLAVFLVFVFSSRKRYFRFPGFLFMLGAVFCMLLFFFPFTAGNGPGSSLESHKTILTPGAFNPVEKGIIYITPSDITGRNSGVILTEGEEITPVSGIQPDYNRIIRFSDGRTVRTEKVNPVFSPLFTAEPFLGDFLDDITAVQKGLNSTLDRSRQEYLLFIFALALFCAACGTLSRISRWPVVNFIISLGIFRLTFLLYRVFSEEVGREMVSILSNRLATENLPYFIFIIAAVLLVIWDILFLKNNWKRN